MERRSGQDEARRKLEAEARALVNELKDRPELLRLVVDLALAMAKDTPKRRR